MSALLILLILLPLSIYRQMQAHEVTATALIRLPLIYVAIGLVGFGTHDLHLTAAAAPYIAVSAVLSIAFGIWRGAQVRVWRDADETPFTQGTRLTLVLWAGLILCKVAINTVGSIAGALPSTHPGEIFLFIAVSFVAQNLIVARRTIWNAPRPSGRLVLPDSRRAES
jgi:hypothetical protein